MKHKKKRINSFKNWLLARDSASRISTFPNYFSFLESEEPQERIKTRSELMDDFEAITDSSVFYKLNQLLNPGVSKWARIDEENPYAFMLINSPKRRYSLGPLSDFYKCLSPEHNGYFPPIRIEIRQGIQNLEISESDFGIVSFVPMSFNKKQIGESFSKIVMEAIDKTSWDKDYVTEFFKFWIKSFTLQGNKYDNFMKSFESAFVEWLKVAPKEQARQAYLDVLNNSKGKDLSEVVDHINQGIKEFGIEIGDVSKGHGLISRYEP